MASPAIQQFFGSGSGGLLPPSAIPQAVMSSPPRHQGSDDRNLNLYVEWLISKRPAQQVQLDTAREKLHADGWGYSKLRKITDSQWDKTGIGAGTICTLKEEMRAWEAPSKEDEDVDSDGSFFSLGDI